MAAHRKLDQRRACRCAGLRPKSIDTIAQITYKIFDYVIRRFNAPSAGLKSGLNLR
jgi:hypothetical protein